MANGCEGKDRTTSATPGRPLITVYFSPKGGGTAAIIEQRDGAARSIDVQAYALTSAEIARALGSDHR